MGTGPHVPDGHRSIGPRVGGGPGWAVGYRMTVPRASPRWGSSGAHRLLRTASKAPGTGPQACPDDGVHPGRAEVAGVGRAERVVAQHPPPVGFGAHGALHRELPRTGDPADEHDVSGTRRDSE